MKLYKAVVENEEQAKELRTKFNLSISEHFPRHIVFDVNYYYQFDTDRNTSYGNFENDLFNSIQAEQYEFECDKPKPFSWENCKKGDMIYLENHEWEFIVYDKKHDLVYLLPPLNFTEITINKGKEFIQKNNPKLRNQNEI